MARVLALRAAGEDVVTLSVYRWIEPDDFLPAQRLADAVCAGSVDAVTVVCPTEHLKTQWALAAARVGIQLDHSFRNADVHSSRDFHGAVVTYSRKVFIPLTRLCRDVCAYCTFATTPSQVTSPFLSPDEVLEIARRGRAAGCDEALFTLGDKPEFRYQAARDALAGLGYARTIDYLAALCEAVSRDTGLLPHVNAGVMDEADIATLRTVSVSQGLMLESAADRLMTPGHAHYGSPDKAPAARVAMIEAIESKFTKE